MRVTSFKAQYRQAPPRSSTPPPPAYEPLSPARVVGGSDQSATPASSRGRASTQHAVASGRAPRASLQVAAPAALVPDPPLRSAPLPSTALQQSPALGSPIDALADAAISSLQGGRAPFDAPRRASYTPISPTADLPPPYPNERGLKHAHPDDAARTHEARPSKRARSEFFPSPLQVHGRQPSRPATSHIPGWSYNVEQMVDTGVRMYNDNVASPQYQHDSQSKRLSDAQLLLDFHNAVSASQPSPSLTTTTKRRSIAHPEAAWPHSAFSNFDPVDPFANTSYGGITHPDPLYAPRAVVFAPSTEHGSTSGVALSTLSLQTHTPPEDSATPLLPGASGPVLVLEDKKARKPSGWPKGKVRGSRAGAAGEKKKKTAPKVKLPPAQTVALDSEQLHSPLSLPVRRLGSPAGRAGMSPRDNMGTARDTGLVAHETPSQSRRHSFSNTFDHTVPSPRPASSASRARSVPLLDGMVQSIVHDGSPKVIRHREIDDPICAGCHSFDSVTSIGDGEQWISCDGCKGWFHYTCAGFNSEREVREIDKFYCDACKPKFGNTTKVRKSRRAHTAVDYAGLNEGILKTSDDNPEHHYIQAFKNGDIVFAPETFARLPAEYVTADFIEKMNGFREPIVIPAALNPRPTSPSAPSSRQTASNELKPDYLGDRQDGLEWVTDDGQDKIDMVIPEGLTVRRVSELYGPSETVPVIDVKAQEGEDKRWTMAKWADYYEQEGEKRVRNVISLEVSRSRLGRLIRRPKVVREMDLQDSVWPEEDKAHAPPVQFYCLMSVADCYTDFHIDFGGSSVYYHIVKGRKTFFFIPPTKQNLKKYEDWCLSSRQSHDFLGQQVKECYRVDLYPGDTMLIPSGWIHAVWTPENSLVIGGNYLTRIHYGMQIKVVEVEKNTKVAPKFRYPFFQKIMWRALIKYLEEDPVPPTIEALLLEGGEFDRPIPIYCEPDKFGHNSDLGPENYNRRYYPKAELEGLPDLVNYIWRTVLISQGKIEGISQTSRNAVNRSIPKSHGEPSSLARRFAMWVAWKRGNEQIPLWAQSDLSAADADKKFSVAQVKKIERESWSETLKLVRGGERHSSLRARASEPTTISNVDTQGQAAPPVTGFLRPHREHVTTPKTSQLGPKRIACDACRKRRIRCKHKDDLVESPQSSGVTGSLTNGTMSGSPPTPSLGVLAARRHSDAGITSSTFSFPPTLYDAQASMNGGPVSAELNAEGLANKSGRVKACADCRKSKRRCIHDEHGNIDPVKAAETPVPRGSATKKRRISNEHDGEAINKRIKRESFAGLVNGEVSRWNRYPLQKPRAASAIEQRDMIPSLAPDSIAQGSRASVIPDAQLPRDEEAIIDDAPLWSVDRTTIVSTIERSPGEPMDGVIVETPVDASSITPRPHTPGPSHAEELEGPNGTSHTPEPSLLDVARAASSHASASRPAKATFTTHKTKSSTPKSTPGKKGRRDSKEAIRLDSKIREPSSTENEADIASYALAMKLQQEEYSLRRRSK